MTGLRPYGRKRRTNESGLCVARYFVPRSTHSFRTRVRVVAALLPEQ